MLPARVPIAPDAIGREVWLVRQGKLLFRENEEEDMKASPSGHRFTSRG